MRGSTFRSPAFGGGVMLAASRHSPHSSPPPPPPFSHSPMTTPSPTVASPQAAPPPLPMRRSPLSHALGTSATSAPTACAPAASPADVAASMESPVSAARMGDCSGPGAYGGAAAAAAASSSDAAAAACSSKFGRWDFFRWADEEDELEEEAEIADEGWQVGNAEDAEELGLGFTRAGPAAICGSELRWGREGERMSASCSDAERGGSRMMAAVTRSGSSGIPRGSIPSSSSSSSDFEDRSVGNGSSGLHVLVGEREADFDGIYRPNPASPHSLSSTAAAAAAAPADYFPRHASCPSSPSRKAPPAGLPADYTAPVVRYAAPSEAQLPATPAMSVILADPYSLTTKDLDPYGNARASLPSSPSSSAPAPVPSAVLDLVSAVRAGLATGAQPASAHGGLGGAYVFRDERGRNVAIVKPTDEEPLAPNNPNGYVGRALGQPGLKRSIRVGEAALREAAAYVLDHGGFAGVPCTALVWAAHPIFHVNSACPLAAQPPRAQAQASPPPPPSPPAAGLRLCSLQRYEEHDFDASEHGTSRFPVRAVQRMGILDVRLLNTDRHSGNILVRRLSAAESAREGAGGGAGAAERRGGLRAQARARALEDEAVRLIPIDHGFCLPETLESAYFEWLHWPQASLPFSPDELEYIAALDASRDVRLLQSRLPALPCGCLRVLRVTTALLQRAAARGMTLAGIGALVTREVQGREETPSDLEVACWEALEEMRAMGGMGRIGGVEKGGYGDGSGEESSGEPGGVGLTRDVEAMWCGGDDGDDDCDGDGGWVDGRTIEGTVLVGGEGRQAGVGGSDEAGGDTTAPGAAAAAAAASLCSSMQERALLDRKADWRWAGEADNNDDDVAAAAGDAGADAGSVACGGDWHDAYRGGGACASAFTTTEQFHFDDEHFFPPPYPAVAAAPATTKPAAAAAAAAATVAAAATTAAGIPPSRSRVASLPFPEASPASSACSMRPRTSAPLLDMLLPSGTGCIPGSCSAFGSARHGPCSAFGSASSQQHPDQQQQYQNVLRALPALELSPYLSPLSLTAASGSCDSLLLSHTDLSAGEEGGVGGGVGAEGGGEGPLCGQLLDASASFPASLAPSASFRSLSPFNALGDKSGSFERFQPLEAPRASAAFASSMIVGALPVSSRSAAAVATLEQEQEDQEEQEQQDEQEQEEEEEKQQQEEQHGKVLLSYSLDGGALGGVRPAESVRLAAAGIGGIPAAAVAAAAAGAAAGVAAGGAAGLTGVGGVGAAEAAGVAGGAAGAAGAGPSEWMDLGGMSEEAWEVFFPLLLARLDDLIERRSGECISRRLQFGTSCRF